MPYPTAVQKESPRSLWHFPPSFRGWLILGFILLTRTTPILAAYQTTFTADYNGNAGPFEKAKLLNTARGGQGIIGDLTWMPKFNAPMAEIGIKEFRVDWLFDDWPYYVVSRNGAGQLTYDFSRLDKVIIPMVTNGITPVMCMTYMPNALAGTGYEPTNYLDYKAAIKAYVEHYLALGYSGWTWESHNEPEGFTTLTPTQTYQMYKVFAAAVKEADATARVGGFGATGTDWAAYLNSFMDQYKADVLANSAPPMDYFSIHQYGGDTFSQVAFAENAFWSRGLTPPQIYLTEWNNGFSTNILEGNAGVTGGGYDTSTNAAYVAMKLNNALSYYWLRRAYFWNFADTVTSKQFSGDLGLFTVDAHRKATANVFWMFNRLHPTILTTTQTGTGASNKRVASLITKDSASGKVALVLWNYQTTGVEISITLSNLPFASLGKNIRLDRHLIDARHGNYYYDYLNGNTNNPVGPNENAALVESTILLPTNTLVRGEYLPPCSVVQLTLEPTSDPVLGGKFTGTQFGASPFYNNDPQYSYTKAFDGNTTTFYNYANLDGGYVGLNTTTTQIVTRVRFVARAGFNRMIGGKIQGSLTSPTSGMVDLYTITNEPAPGWNEITVTPGRYRYLRYLGSATSLGEIAELEFYGADVVPPTLTTFTNIIFHNTPVGTVVGTVTMNDADQYQVPLTASIISGNTGGAFNIHPVTGEISVATNLAVPATFDLQIAVTDNVPGQSLTNSGYVRITVISNTTSFVPGLVQYSLFYSNGYSGNIADLTNSARWPNDPDAEFFQPAFEGSNNIADNFGATLRGYLLPPASGSYTFWVAGDDYAELWLSTSTNPAAISRIALTTNWTGPREWTKYNGQQSAPVLLNAGQAYYAEVRMKESSGGDNAAVAWRGPSTANQTNLITGIHLAPFRQNYPPRASTFAANLRQNVGLGTVVGTITVSDANVADTHSFAISGGDPTGIFTMDASGTLRVTNPAALLAAAPGTNILQITVTDSGTPPLAATTNVSINLLSSNAAIPAIVREIWTGLPSGSLILFTNTPAYPNFPDTFQLLTNFASMQNTTDNYGSRIRAYVTPPQTGNYRFFVSGDDVAAVWVSTDESPTNATLVASLATYTLPNVWNAYTSQVSPLRPLVAGQRYYVEVLQKESDGGDFVQVGWSGPGLTGTNVIAGAFLTPFDANLAPIIGSGSWRITRSATNGTALGSISASSPDADRVTFFISGGNTSNTFSINPDSGLITLTDAQPLADLNLTNFNLIVTAQDSGHDGLYPIRSANTAANIHVITGPDASLYCWLKFDETSGVIASDSSGSGNPASLWSGATFASGWQSNSLSLDGANDYARLPFGIFTNLQDCTIAAWVKLDTAPAKARLFDCGLNVIRYLHLSPNSISNSLRFAITLNGSANEQQINAPPLPTGVWKHVAVTLQGDTGILYVDAQPVATNANLTLNPSDLGYTTLNYLGKSQFSDPYLDGSVDDFRIYNRALNVSELAGLINPPPSAPVGVVAIPGNQQVTLQWNTVPGASTYQVKRGLDGFIVTAIASVTTTNFVDVNLVNDTSYFYAVSAANSGGEGSNSALVNATPRAPRIGVTLLNSDLLVTWPAWASDHAVYAATNLTPPAAWTLLPNQPVLNGTNLSLTIPVTNSGNLFLRLQK
jgi:hypothetical protein